MKADALTKLECSLKQRRLVLHNVLDPMELVEGDSESESDDDCDPAKTGDLLIGRSNTSRSQASFFTAELFNEWHQL